MIEQDIHRTSVLLRLVRAVCYIALAVVGTATAITIALDSFNICPNLSETGLHCKVKAVEGIGNVAFGIVMVSVFSVVPAVLAIAGLVFAAIDLVRRARRASS